jgi:hypothetical protein
MKVGLLPLVVAVVAASARVFGSSVTADIFATVYLLHATVMISRPDAIASPSRI